MTHVFKAELVFTTWEDAKGAEDELRGAGFQTEITDDVDDDSGAVFMVVSRLCELDPMKEVEAIVDPFDGFCPEWKFAA